MMPNLVTFNEWESIVSPYAMAYWRISCSYILSQFPLFDKTFTNRLSTDFLKFSISSATVLCMCGLKNAIPQLIFGCILFTTSVKLHFQQTPEIVYGITRSGDKDDHVIKFSLLNPIFPRYSTVERAACHSALSCMKIIFFLNAGRLLLDQGVK